MNPSAVSLKESPKLLIRIAESELGEQERMGGRRPAVDLVNRIGVLGQRGKTPDSPVAQVDDYLAVDLAAAVRGSQHGGAGLNVKRVAFGTLCVHRRRDENGAEGDRTQEHGDREKQKLHKP